MATVYDHPISPRRCPECGGVMVWGQMRQDVTGMLGGPTLQHAEAPTVERADVRGQWFAVTVNICTQCGRIGLYMAYPQ